MRKSPVIKFTWAFMFMLVALSCGKDKEGCMEKNAINFDRKATIEDGSCEFSPEVLWGFEFGSMTDQEGNHYATIVIGNQEWMAENLRTTTYANGDPIPNVTDNTQWQNLTTGAWAHYNNDSQYENPYGKLYNWYTVADPRNVCPTGWHVPSDAEWTVLTDYLGGSQVAGGKMKSTQHWPHPNVGATNESGFSGLPGGVRLAVDGDSFFFYGIGEGGIWWSSTERTTGSAWYRGLGYDYGGVGRSNDGKGRGFSVRCLRD